MTQPEILSGLRLRYGDAIDELLRLGERGQATIDLLLTPAPKIKPAPIAEPRVVSAPLEPKRLPPDADCADCGEQVAYPANRCAPCALAVTRKNRARTYGLSVPDQVALWQRQGGRCAICEVEFESERDAKLDHDHRTGAVRAFLCNRCNTQLGVLELPTQPAAAAYLAKHAAE